MKGPDKVFASVGGYLAERMVIIHNYSLPQLVETEKKIWFIDNEMFKDYHVINVKRVSETGFKLD